MWKRIYPQILHADDNLEELLLVKTKITRQNMPESLQCPRFEDQPGDDMDECEKPPGWIELSRAEKLDILDWEMECYWREHPDVQAMDNKSFLRALCIHTIAIITPFVMFSRYQSQSLLH